MPEVPPKDPPFRGEETTSATDALVKILGTVGVLAGAFSGSKLLMKHLPPQIKKRAEEWIIEHGLRGIEKLAKSDTLKNISRSVFNAPGVNSLPMERALADLSSKELGLLHDIQTVSRLGNPAPDIISNIQKQVVADYDLKIPQLRKGAFRRMTLGDLWNSVTAGHVNLNNTNVIKDVDLGITARKLGMSVQDLHSMRLDPFVFIHEKTGQVVNLNKLNVPARMLDGIENVKILGIPFFKMRGDQRATKFGMGLFGRTATDPTDPPHALVKMLTGKDHGELFVMKDRAWYRGTENASWELMEDIGKKWEITSDFKLAEMGARSTLSNPQFDELMYGLQKPTKAGEKLRRALGVGPEYMSFGQKSLIQNVTSADMDELAKNPTLKNNLKLFLARIDPLKLAGSTFDPDAAIGSGLGARSNVLGTTEKPGSIYLKRKGFGGLSDWLNEQVARPLYLVNWMGVGIRPGRNALTTLGKMSALATGAYMGKEALSYADWATGNVVSSGVGKALGFANYLRQTVLDQTGLRGDIENIEKETPGLISSPLSQMIRAALIPMAGAAIGRKMGGARILQKALRNLARGGLLKSGYGRDFARGLLANNSSQQAAGALQGALAGGLATLAMSGDLSQRPEHVREEMRGERKVEYRTSAGWMLGRDPFSGGRIRFGQPSQYFTAGTDYNAIGVYGSEENKWKYGSWLPTVQNWGGLRRLLNPYFAEERNAGTRPYPVTSGHFGEVPIFGPMLQSTVGTLLKPQVYRGDNINTLAALNNSAHEAGMRGGSLSMSFSGDSRGFTAGSPEQMSGMGYGGSVYPTGAGSPNAVGLAITESLKRVEEYTGLRGFQSQFIRNQLGLGGEAKPILAGSGNMTSVARSYYDTDPGGMFGGTELLRRFITRGSNNPEINTIPNTMPSWLPGSRSLFEGDRDFYADFSLGDPYTKIPMGEARLPGPGHSALYKKHGGAAYDVVDSFLILADVAPFTDSYRVMKMEVERLIRQDKLSPEWIRRYRIAVEQAESKADFRVFHSDRYRRRESAVIERVLGPTKFQLRDGRIIDLEGTRLDYAEPDVLIAQRMENGMTAQEARLSVDQDKARVRRMLEERIGQNINIDITGSHRGSLQGRVPEMEDVLSQMGVVEEDNLYEQGIVGRGYTQAGKLLGEAGAAGGLAYSLLSSRATNKMSLLQSGSKGGRVLHAAASMFIGGLIGGWGENKFTGDFSAREHYERFQVYGSSYADWNSPVNSFLRPWAHSAASTFADYTPSHRKDQYQIEEYFDNLKYMKYKGLEKEAQDAGYSQLAYEYGQMSTETLAAMNYEELTPNSPGLHEALPANERQYFKQFAGQEDPREQLAIAQAVPDYMKSVYLSIWKNRRQQDFELEELQELYRRHVTPKIGQSPDEQVQNFFSSRALPSREWRGWHPAANLNDVKYKTIQFSGGSPHDHGLFASQGRRIDAFQPWVGDAGQELASSYNGGYETMFNRLRGSTPDLNTHITSSMSPISNVVYYGNDINRYDSYYAGRAAGPSGLY